MRSALLSLVILTPALTLAQTTPHPEDFGTVTGHVICADTQRPARLAIVRLIPVREPTADGPRDSYSSVGQGLVGAAVHTDLTGAYTIAAVEPGQYYLRIDLTGYATPISQFTADELKSPTPQVQQRIQRELQLVTAAPNATVEADATLRRGGSISGTLTYDDGSPAIGVAVTLLRHDAGGRLRQLGFGTSATHTNGEGHFYIESLSPGAYVIEAKLNSFESGQMTTFSNGKLQTLPMEQTASSLPVYSGNVFRQKDATSITIELSHESDVEISIPLGQLHEISGTVSAKNGHVINSATITLLDPDTQDQVAASGITSDGMFHLIHVPEGSYILKVTHASDMSPLVMHVAPDHKTATSESHPLHTYGNVEQPLSVQTDIQSLNVTVPDQSSTTASSQ